MSDIFKLGDLVHYTAHGTPNGEYSKTCRAAFITDVVDCETEDGQCLSLRVDNPTGQFFNTHVQQDASSETEEYEGGHWHFALECQYDR